MAAPYNPFQGAGGLFSDENPLGPATRDAFSHLMRGRAAHRQGQDRLAKRDPLDDQIAQLNERRTNLRYQRAAMETQVESFLTDDRPEGGGDLFDRDPLTGKLTKVNGELSPRWTKEIDELRIKAGQKTGLIAGAFSPSKQHGDPTDEAAAAQRKLSEVEHRRKLQLEKLERMRAPLRTIEEFDGQLIGHLGELGRLREERHRNSAQTVPGTWQGTMTVPMAQGQAASVGSVPEDIHPADPQTANGAPRVTPAAMVRLHAQLKKAEAAGDSITAENLQSQLQAGMLQLDPERQQRVIKATRDPGLWEGLANAARNAFDSSRQALIVADGLDPDNAEELAAIERGKQARLVSPAYAAYQQAEGWDAVRAFTENPVEVTSNIIAEGLAGSLPTLGAGLGAGGAGAGTAALAGTIVPGIGNVIGAAGGFTVGMVAGTGAGSFATEYGSKILEELQTAGMDLADPESITTFFADPERLEAAKAKAVKRGVPVAAFDALSAGVAGRMGRILRTAGKAPLKTVAAEVAAQGAAGGAGEVAGSLAAGDPVSGKAVFGEIIGEVGPGAVQVAAGRMASGRARQDDSPPPSSESGQPQPDPETDGGPAAEQLDEAPEPTAFEFINDAGQRATVTAPTMRAALQQLPESFGDVAGVREIAASAVASEAAASQTAPSEAEASVPAPASESGGSTDPRSVPTNAVAGENRRPNRIDFVGGTSTGENVTGTEVDDEWAAFSPESGSLGIPRSEMPQVRNEHRGALTQFLKTRGIEHVEAEVLPGSLKPTQAEYSPAKVDKARSFEGGDRAILVSSDGHVLDGHHQWIAALTDKPTEPFRTIRLNAPIRDLITRVKEFPSVEAAGGVTEVRQPNSQRPSQATAALTPAARALIEKIDNGGAAPAFISKSLERIAAENDVEITRTMTPQDVVSALRSKQSMPEPAALTSPVTGGKVSETETVGPAPAPEATAKPPAIERGANKPAKFIQAVAKASGLKAKDKATRFLQDFAPRLHKANAKAFEQMEVHVLKQPEWDAHPRVGTETPDSSAAYNPMENTLYLNADKMRGNDGVDAISAVVHEAGHFAEQFALGEAMTQREWEKISHEQRRAAWQEYAGEDYTGDAVALLKDRRARAEWTAMQFARVVRGDTDQMPKRVVAKMREFLETVRDLVRKWVGAKSLTTAELDSWILDKLGYAKREQGAGGREKEADTKRADSGVNIKAPEIKGGQDSGQSSAAAAQTSVEPAPPAGTTEGDGQPAVAPPASAEPSGGNAAADVRRPKAVAAKDGGDTPGAVDDRPAPAASRERREGGGTEPVGPASVAEPRPADAGEASDVAEAARDDSERGGGGDRGRARGGAEPVAEKEKWQMTRAEYARAQRLAENPNASAVTPELEADVTKLWGPGHETFVKRAIAEGKVVPPEVLADYPDIKSGTREGSTGISDFGEKIAGAKKDLWGQWGRAMREDLPANAESITLAKNFPEPNYEAAIKAGASVENLATIAALRDLVPAKPRTPYKLGRWAELVRNLHGVARKIVDGNFALNAEAVDALLKRAEPHGGAITRKVSMYRKLGYPLFTKAKEWEITNGSFSYFGGTRYDSPKSITYAAEARRTHYDLSSENPNSTAAFDEVVTKLRLHLEAKPEEKKSAETKFGLYRDRKTNEVFIGKKGVNGVVRIKAGFTKAEEARAYLRDNREDLEKTWAAMKVPPELRRAANNPREGIARRTGDVTPQVFQDTFGFRGVQFGNYVEDARRQADLNEAFDAFMDMAEAIGVPPNALSLDGSLALAFGARGGGGHVAHYEPDQVVINITKTRGPGSMAHEWFHGLDNYFARLEITGSTAPTPVDSFASRAFSPAEIARPKTVRVEVWDAFKKIRDVLAEGPFSERSDELDATRSKAYYGTTIEKAARAFETYVEERLDAKDISNDYLVNINKAETRPYPSKEEMDAGIRAAFDNLFNTLEVKEGRSGAMLGTPANQLGPNVTTYQYTIQKPFDLGNGRTVPGYTQIDEIIEGVNTRSSSLEELRAEGLDLPDVPDSLPTGQYTLEEVRRAAAGETILGTPTSPPLDDGTPAAQMWRHAKPDELPESLRQQVSEFEAAINRSSAEGEPAVRLTPQVLSDHGARLSAGVADRFRRQVEQVFGKRIVFVAPSEDVGWGAVSSPQRANTVLVNTRTEAPLMALTGHELAHNLKTQRPDLHTRLSTAIAEFAPLPLEYVEKKRLQGYDTDERVNDEWVSDVVGERWVEPAFWTEVQRVTGQTPNAFTELADAALAWLKRIVTRAENVLSREAQMEFLPQVEQVRTAIAKALRDYADGATYAENPLGSASDTDLTKSTAETRFEEAGPAPEPKPEKPAPVVGKPGWFHRSESDSLRAVGVKVARQMYERRSHADAAATAKAVVDEIGEDQASRLALDRNDNGMPGDVKTILYGELIARKARRIADPTTSPAARARLQREIQQLDNVKAPGFTERGQEISALQQVYKNAHAATMVEYLDDTRRKQDGALGGDAGKKELQDATRTLTKVDSDAVEQATKELTGRLDKMEVGIPLWQRYREWAANRLLEWVEDRATMPQGKAPLVEFTNRILDEIRSRMDSAIPKIAAQDRPKPTAAELLREAVENKEKYAEVVKTTRSAFAEQYGADSPIVAEIDIALGNLGLKPYSRRLLDQAIDEAHAAMKTNVAEIARMHYTNADRLHRNVADALVTIAGVPKKEAKALAADLESRMQELTANAKKAALERLRKKYDSPRAKRILKAIERAVLLNNYGAMSRTELAGIVAKELKLPDINPAQMTKLSKLADDVETAPNEAAKARAELSLANEMRIVRGISKTDIATSIWYANLLSGYATQLANVGGNVMNGTLNLASVMATNPRHAGEALRGWIEGFGEGWQQGKAIIATGRGSREFDAKTGTASPVLELVDYRREFPNLNESIAKGLNLHAKALRYVFRTMQAVDAVFYYPAREAYARVAVAKLLEGKYEGKELYAKVRETLAISPAAFAQARAKAEREGFTGLGLSMRTANIIESMRRDTAIGREAAERSEKFALETTFNNEPVGWAGVFYRHAAELTEQMKPGGVPVLKAFLPFLRIPTNLFNTSMNYTPVGTLRAFRGMEGRKKGERVEFNDDERSRLLVQSIGGSLAMGGLAALALGAGADDGDEPAFTITATGPSDYRARQQLQATGWNQHSIKIGDAWISYKDSPILTPLALVGHVVDAIRYKKTKDELTLGSMVADAVLKAPGVIFETSMLSGLGQLFDLLESRASATQVRQFLTRTATATVVPNLLGQLDRTFNPEMRYADGSLGEVGAALPFVRNTGTPRSDVFGESVERAPLERFVRLETNDRIREVLRDKNVFISVPRRDTKVGGQVMTEEQYEAYVRISGQGIRTRLSGALPRLRQMDRESLERLVDRITDHERQRAKILVSRQLVAGRN